MPNMTLALPDDLHKIMRKYNEIKWSTVARDALWRYAARMEEFEQKIKESGEDEETEQFALELGRKIKRGMARRHGLLK